MYEQRAEDIKAKIDLRVYVEDDQGAPKERGNGYWKFNCPLGTHRDSSPSFTVWQDHYYCYGCQAHGDVITFVQARTGKDFKEAMALLDGSEDLPRYKPRSYVVEKKSTVLTLKDVEGYHANVSWVSEYLRSRRIGDAIADIELLGATRYSRRYFDSDGKEWTFACNRVALPYLFNDEVYSINFRRDDLSAVQCLERIGKQANMDMARFLREDLAKKAGVDADQIKARDVMDRAFGPRFYRPGTPVTAYGVHNLVRKSADGGLLYPRRTYCILTEGEFNQLSCETERFTSMAAKPVERVNFRRLLQNVRIVFVAVDADAAGDVYADKILKAMGGDYTKIRKMVLPEGFNDMNDLHKVDALNRYLTSKPYYLEPVV